MSALKDITGQQFNNWLVIERAENNKSGNARWLCECQCENKTRQIITGSQLRNEHTKQCKKCAGKITGERCKKDLSNQRFGKLIAIEPTNRSTPQGNAIWKCLCDCGRYTEVASNNLGRTTLSCGMCGPHSHGELKIEKLLNDNNINFKTQYSIPELVSDTNTRLYFDFYVDDKYLIEYDGEQHFDFNGRGWNTKENFEKQQQRDKLKNEYCKQHNIPLIRIPYTHYNDLKIEDLLLETSNFII